MDRLMLMAMGGYGDMEMMGGSTAGTGLIDSLKTKLSFLPEWAAILVIAVLVILAAMLVGWIGGKIIGSILYPDPDKQSILSKKQKFMVLGGAIAAIALTIFALTYTPAPDTGDDVLPTGENVSMDGMDGMESETAGWKKFLIPGAAVLFVIVVTAVIIIVKKKKKKAEEFDDEDE